VSCVDPPDGEDDRQQEGRHHGHDEEQEPRTTPAATTADTISGSPVPVAGSGVTAVSEAMADILLHAGAEVR
jgi:hypothetical protein